MSFDQTVNLLSAIGQFGAAILALVALVISVRTSRSQSETSDRIASEQSRLLSEQIRIQRDSDILRWTEQVIDLLSEADTFAAELGTVTFDDLAEARRRRIQARLSALIDHGRMYFPNDRIEAKGAGNHRAYRGHRQAILDALVSSYESLKEAHHVKSEAEASALCAKIVDFRRQFVSEAQAAIDPHRFIELKEMNLRRTERGLPQHVPHANGSVVKS